MSASSPVTWEAEKALGTALEKADAEVDFTVPGFQHCSIGVTASTSLWVSVGDLFDNSDNIVWPSEDVEVSRSMRRQSIEIEDDGCVRTLTFADARRRGADDRPVGGRAHSSTAAW